MKVLDVQLGYQDMLGINILNVSNDDNNNKMIFLFQKRLSNILNSHLLTP